MNEIIPLKEPRAHAGLATKLPAVAVRSNADAEKVRRQTCEVPPRYFAVWDLSECSISRRRIALIRV